MTLYEFLTAHYKPSRFQGRLYGIYLSRAC